MSSFRRVQEQSCRFVTKLEEFSGIQRYLIENIIQYAKQLTKDDHGEIDSVIFMSQMAKQFEIYSSTLLLSMYESLKKPKSTGVSLEEFCKCLCIFLSDRIDIKADFVFRVYDYNKDGILNKYEVQTLLKPCMEAQEHDEAEESVRELTDLVFKMLNKDGDGNVHMEEFRKLVKNNSTYIELLGRCLPSEKSLQRFIGRLSGKTPYEVRAEFSQEKYETLDGIKRVNGSIKKESKLYPVILDMP
ncbi:hypothetical protein Btru_063733 [Bulinus truncatus]|nr:hypothetical protein Btru_063733 [Bulinus truncatus]